eukprot:c24657_g1_i1 orf=295-2484(-)
MHSLRNVRWICCAMQSCAPLRQGRPGYNEGRMLWPLRYYGEEVGSQRRQRKSKEERRVLIISFVQQYMALHEGQFPELRTVLKEVGGAYAIVKEIFQDLMMNQTCGAIQNKGVKGTSGKNERLDDDVMKSVLGTTDMMGSSNQAGVATHKILNASKKDEFQEIIVSEAAGSPVIKQGAAEMGDKEIMAEMKHMQRTESLHRSDSTAGTFVEKIKKREAGEVSDELNLSQGLILHDKIPAVGLLQSRELRTKLGYAMSSNEETKDTVQCFPAENEQKPEMQQRVVDVARLSQLECALQTTRDVMASDNETEDDPDFAAPEYTHACDMKPMATDDNWHRSPVPALEYVLHLRSLPSSATESDLKESFKECGEILNVQVLPSHHSGSQSTCGTINFRTAEGLAKAQMKDTFMIRNIEVLVDQVATKASLGIKDTSPTSSTIKRTRDQSYKAADKAHRREEVGHPSLSGKFQAAEPVHDTSLSSGSSEEVGKTVIPLKSSGMSMEARNGMHSLKKACPFGVFLQNVPDKINISEVRAAMSLYGEVNAVHRRPGAGATTGYLVEFKTHVSQLLLLANNWIVLRNHPYQVVYAGNPMTTIVRLSNVPSDVTTNTIRTICYAEGPVVNVEQRKGNIMDVHFGSKVLPYMRKLVARLNTVTIKDARLCAFPAQRFPCRKRHPALALPDQQEVLKVCQGGLLDEIDACGKQMRVDLEDLSSLMNLKIRSMTRKFGRVN